MAWEQASGRKERYFKIRPYHSPFIGSNNAYVAICGGAQCFAQPQSPLDMLETLSFQSMSKPAAVHLVQYHFDIRRGLHYAPSVTRNIMPFIYQRIER
jgi:hypothetical protein